MNKITEIIGKLKYGNCNALSLPAVSATDFSFMRDDADFALRAADVIMQADCSGWNDLLEAMAQHMETCSLDAGDEAFADAALHLRAAVRALASRAGY